MFGVRRLWPYLIGSGLLWYAMLASGIHPTVAGVLAAFAIRWEKASRNPRSSGWSMRSTLG
jgi:NhaA family Na+:H+ antiporter